MTLLDARCPACGSAELSGTEEGDIICRACGARSSVSGSGYLQLESRTDEYRGSEDAKARAALGRAKEWPDESQWGADNRRFCEFFRG